MKKPESRASTTEKMFSGSSSQVKASAQNLHGVGEDRGRYHNRKQRESELQE